MDARQMSIFNFSILDSVCNVTLRVGSFSSLGVDCSTPWIDRLAQVFGP